MCEKENGKSSNTPEHIKLTPGHYGSLSVESKSIKKFFPRKTIFYNGAMWVEWQLFYFEILQFLLLQEKIDGLGPLMVFSKVVKCFNLEGS